MYPPHFLNSETTEGKKEFLQAWLFWGGFEKIILRIEMSPAKYVTCARNCDFLAALLSSPPFESC